MRTYLEEFDEDDEDDVQKFLDDIKKFNDNLKKQNGKLGSSSSALTGYITDDSYELDYGEVGKAVEPSVGKSDSNFLKTRPFSIEDMKDNTDAVVDNLVGNPVGNPVAAI